jgi:hypothetical protein
MMRTDSDRMDRAQDVIVVISAFPIISLFFNADLVPSKLNRNQGPITFVDNYTALGDRGFSIS